MSIQRALVSVSDKTGVVALAARLNACDIDIISTGGTAALLNREGIRVRSVGAYTGFPEIMDGRVKTLHPRVHGGVLAVRDNPGHMQQMAANNILPIDLVVVNLYPFKQVTDRPDVSTEEAVENIDIGGLSVIRSAAKNHRYVTVLIDPADYDIVAAEIERDGDAKPDTRRRLAQKAFTYTADYDAAVSAFLKKAYG